MQFTRLRLSGFKSFVDPTELKIEPGLTGVVGPNGCGKSNLLEALRWVMGENRAKSLRGTGMDDVIFAGTANRPARNLADVTLFIDNESRDAPAHFNDLPELEISRRIERESGSAYRINGKDVRAKDVQLLFADAATGAHSPALVSQGMIGSLINAKPKDRRAILEEAAGVTGLYTRRKEAEQRLRAAENNLVRLHDVMGQMEGQINSLRRQAAQATRYRNISGDIRRAEGTLYYLRWKALDEAVLEAELKLNEARSIVAERTRATAEVSGEHTGLAAKLPELRQAEASSAAAVHRLGVARDNLQAELERISQQKNDMQSRIALIVADRRREQEHLSDSDEAMQRIKEEEDALSKNTGSDEAEEQKAATAVQKAHEQASAAETQLDEASSTVAGHRARTESMGEELAAIDARLVRLNDEHARVQAELATLKEGDTHLKALTEANVTMENAMKALQQSIKALDVAEETRLKASDNKDEARSRHAEARNALAQLDAEIQGLKNLIESATGTDDAPIADKIRVTKGFENALGAALGDDIDAPESDDGAIGWRDLGAMTNAPSLPQSIKPLSAYAKAPKALARRLSQVGVVKDDDGARLAKELAPGQRLVSENGSLWRWDGFHRAADAPSAAAVRLAHKNRLDDLEAGRGALDTALSKAQDAMNKAEQALDDAIEGERAARTARSNADRAVHDARGGLSAAEKEGSERAQRGAALGEAEGRLARDIEEAKARKERTQTAYDALPDLSTSEDELSTLRTHVESLRGKLSEARAEYDGLKRQRVEREQRITQIKRDREAWVGRVERARLQIDALDRREQEARQQMAQLDKSPEEIEDKRKSLIEQLDKAETARQAAADELANVEHMVNDKDHAMRQAQEALLNAREAFARLEAAFQGIQERKQDLVHDIHEKFDCLPEALLEVAEIKDPDNLPDQDAVEKRLERVKAERERLGAVNLRADTELEEVKEQLAHLSAERTDLEEAIARLRQGISALNREGRERLLSAFTKVNDHFGELFSKLFGGGTAHLEMVESDDPLDAGLEIMASPPGKKLQSLSLLSGGEQALTAMSLIFAVFMTNPAPICVLDEVDAPLDDANVERFCDLVVDMTKKTQTRFLIVTHNAVTMSRMDRLFGVTMSERGVSQLVSVDLMKAAQIGAVA